MFFQRHGKNQIDHLAQTGKVKYLMLHSRLERILRKIPVLIIFEIIPRVLPVDLIFDFTSKSQQPAYNNKFLDAYPFAKKSVISVQRQNEQFRTTFKVLLFSARNVTLEISLPFAHFSNPQQSLLKSKQ